MSRQHLVSVLPQMPELDAHDLSAYGNSYHSEDDENDRSDTHSEVHSQMSFLDMDRDAEGVGPIPVDPAILEAQ